MKEKGRRNFVASFLRLLPIVKPGEESKKERSKFECPHTYVLKKANQTINIQSKF